MKDRLDGVRKLVWLYLWLLLFEGALRKWIFPGLSAPLLIIRDPVVIAIYAMAFRHNVFPRSAFIAWIFILGFISFAISFTGIGSIFITIYGMRANFLHLPLIFLMPKILRVEDVKEMGKLVLFVLPLMALLAVLQFKGGTESRWNYGAGGEVAGQLVVAEGKMRASGTFSFVSGMVVYLALSAAFLLYNLLEKNIYSKKLVMAALPALIIALAVSGSRAAVISVGVVCVMVLYISIRLPERFGSAIKPMVLTLIAVAAVSALSPVFKEGIDVHRNRFKSGGGLKEGIAQRTVDGFSTGLDAVFFAPMLGHGLGVGTNAGAAMMTGKRDFTLSEGEWGRVILESGPAMGLAYIALRIAMFLFILMQALKAYMFGETLSLLLVGASGLILINGQFGQPTTLGFAVFVSGLAYAAAQPRSRTETKIPVPVAPNQHAPIIMGRSPYAERLHDDSQS